MYGYNDSLDTLTVVCLTATKFDPFIYSVLCFALMGLCAQNHPYLYLPTARIRLWARANVRLVGGDMFWFCFGLSLGYICMGRSGHPVTSQP